MDLELTSDASVVAPSDQGEGRLTGTDFAGCLVVLALVMGYLPTTGLSWDTPRVAALVGVLPVGAYFVVRLMLARDRAAVLATVALLWMALGSLLSESPGVSLKGAVGRWSNVLVYAAVVGLWAVGRAMTNKGRHTLAWAVAGAGAISAIFAIVQIVTRPTVFDMALEQNRPVGLAGNPIMFGAQMAAIAAFMAFVHCKRTSFWPLAGFAFFATAAALSGSRVALGAVLVIVVWALHARDVRRAAFLVPAVLVAALIGTAIHRLANTGQSAGERIGTSGVRDRLDLWSFALRAWREHPVLGWGLGRFRPATQGYYSDSWAGRFDDELTGAWMDAHNVVVEHLVTTGIIGVVLIATFVCVAVRGASGYGLWMASAIAIGWMLEPAALPTLGLAAWLLGAAAPRVGTLSTEGSTSKTRVLLGVLGFALAGSYVANMAYVDRWLSPDANETSMPWFAPWLKADPIVSSSAASTHTLIDNTDPDVERFVLVWAERTVDQEPDFPRWRAQLASKRLSAGDLKGAQLSAEEGLALQANHPRSLEILQIVALRLRDRELFDVTTARLCRLEHPSCQLEWVDNPDGP